MRKFTLFLSSVVFSIVFCCSAAQAQRNLTFNNPTANAVDEYQFSFSEPKPETAAPSSQIKDIQVFGERSGIAFTRDTLFRTDDNGATWREITVLKSFSETISTVSFLNENVGRVILADTQTARLEIVGTKDGGNSWTKMPINLRREDLLEADLENVIFEFADRDHFTLLLRRPTSSNFSGVSRYESQNGGQSWEFRETSIFPLDSDLQTEKVSANWSLKFEGNCEGFKTGCYNESKIIRGTDEITPPQIINLAHLEKENAELEARNSIFAAPPGGSTRLSLNRGFDKCTAAPVSQMQIWWNTSPFYDSNIYISGRNRGCSQPQLTAAWVNQVSAMGWGLIPTIVGYQAPCSVCATCQKHSFDAGVAETQGRGEADIAIADANNLGLTQGTVLYYDMERYDDLSGTGACSTPVKAFLKGWTDRVKEQGYISGVYGSPTNAVNDWINIPLPSRMDAVWLARWNNVMSVFGVAPLPDTYWTNHQRIHQYIGPRNETWGGVTFNIDNNISDAPVAGAAIAKNKNADFDGDGKTDVSVFRPDTGIWYILKSSDSGFSGITFGNGSDILAPGDYDGDGKTDTAVFRPAEGVWYFLNKAGLLTARQFGANGDVPVPADYNDDGKTDLAVFRPSNGTWYIANSDSLGTFNFVQFGASGDLPVRGDYDGDGKSDIAVFRPSNGSWYVLRSSDGTFSGAAFGASTDVPAQGDFDGDGKTDFAVFRSGIWYLLQTTGGFSAVQFGASGDVPVTGDYDGDNKADVAVFRPSNGAWYLLRSQSGFTGIGFGAVSDKPIPNAYLPQ